MSDRHYCPICKKPFLPNEKTADVIEKHRFCSYGGFTFPDGNVKMVSSNIQHYTVAKLDHIPLLDHAYFTEYWNSRAELMMLVITANLFPLNPA